MKKEYKFPIYSPVVPPQVAFQLVYADGSKSMSFTPDQWEAETYHNTQKVVGWVPARAEITITPEDGKVYKVKVGHLIHYARFSEKWLYLFEGESEPGGKGGLIHPYPSARTEILAEMKEVEE